MKLRLHERVRKLRKERGITQTQMAKKLGYKSVSPYNAFENGKKKRGVTVEQAQVIARELGITLDELLDAKKLRVTRKGDGGEEKSTCQT